MAVLNAVRVRGQCESEIDWLVRVQQRVVGEGNQTLQGRQSKYSKEVSVSQRFNVRFIMVYF